MQRLPTYFLGASERQGLGASLRGKVVLHGRGAAGTMSTGQGASRSRSCDVLPRITWLSFYSDPRCLS